MEEIERYSAQNAADIACTLEQRRCNTAAVFNSVLFHLKAAQMPKPMTSPRISSKLSGPLRLRCKVSGQSSAADAATDAERQFDEKLGLAELNEELLRSSAVLSAISQQEEERAFCK